MPLFERVSIIDRGILLKCCFSWSLDVLPATHSLVERTSSIRLVYRDISEQFDVTNDIQYLGTVIIKVEDKAKSILLIFVVERRFRFHINVGSQIKTVTAVTAQL